MSGICGIVSFDGAQPSAPEIEIVLEPLKRRGPDGANVWTGDGVALGHTLLATTPEAVVEKLPLYHAESGCTITADARLDNRDELFARLGLPDVDISDGELIVRAYLKWGGACVDHLLGDFAFAVWDERQRRLFCARDQMGMRQLTYAHLPGRALVFATEPAAVLRHPAVPNDLNPGRIADFLDDLEHSTLTETFYAAISRLPPAHTLTFDHAGLRLHKYWRLITPPELSLASHREYEEAFLEVFAAAVRARLRSPGPVGAMLSGGMDSSSVVAVAAQILASEGSGPLPSFSVIDSDPTTCAETRAIRAASEISGIEPHFVSLRDLDDYRDELLRLTREQAEPFDAHMGLIRAAYLAAHRRGLKVVLDGVAGDIALNSDSLVARLLRRGRLLAALQEARGERKIWGATWPVWKSLSTAAARAWLPRRVRALRRRAHWWLQDRRIGRVGLIRRDFADRVDLRGRRRLLRARDAFFDRLDEDERRRRIEYASLFVARERYDRVASAVAIEPRDPFMDVRVLEFCLSLPWEQLQAGGWPKLLLRRAMAGKLPDTVRWRQGKEHLGPAFTRELLGPLAVAEARSDRTRETIAPYIHLDSSAAGPGGPQDCTDWVEAICLYQWLESVVRDPQSQRRNSEMSHE
jgi:asparagine synthase (glutamine-hydrolysing)